MDAPLAFALFYQNMRLSIIFYRNVLSELPGDEQNKEAIL